MIKKLWSSTLVRYFVIGGLSFVIELSVLLSLHKGAGLHRTRATAIAFWVGFVAAFFLQKIFAFNDRDRHIKALSRQWIYYALLVIFNYFFTLLLVDLTPDKFLLASRTVALLITTAWNYVIYKHIIFNKNFQLNRVISETTKKYKTLHDQALRSSKFKVFLILLSFLLLASVSIYSAIQTSRLTVNDADAVVNTYLVGDGLKDAKINLQPEHTNLLKFPLFYLQSKLVYNYSSFVALNIMLTLGATLGWAWLGFKLFGKRMGIVNTLLLTFFVSTSVLLNLNTNWTTIRNIEFPIAFYFVYIISKYLRHGMKDRRAVMSITAAGLLYSILLASDAYFLYIVSVPILIYMTILYIERRLTIQRLLTAGVIIVFCSVVAKTILWTAQKIDYLSLSSSGDFSLKIVDFDEFFPAISTAFHKLLELSGGNIFGKSVSLKSVGAYLALLFIIMAIFSAFKVLVTRFSLRTRKTDDVHIHTISITSISFIICFLMFVLSGHAKDGPHRYIVIMLFLACLLIVWVLKKYRSHESFLIIISAALITLSLIGVKLSINTYAQLRLSYSKQTNDYKTAASLLQQEYIDVFGSGHWYGATARFWTHNKILSVPIIGCNKRFSALTRDSWYKPDDQLSRSALIVERQGPDSEFWNDCNDAMIESIYGQPIKVIPYNSTDKILIFDYDIRHKIDKT